MVRLRSLENENGILKCEIYPEDGKIPGYLSVDPVTKEIVECFLPRNYEGCENYVAHAKRRLLKLFENDELPKDEVLVMWF